MNKLGKWRCEYCTYENWPSSNKCTLCHGLRSFWEIPDSQTISKSPTRATSPDEVYRKWSCTACTYLNWPKSVKCVQCLTNRGNPSLSISPRKDVILPLPPLKDAASDENFISSGLITIGKLPRSKDIEKKDQLPKEKASSERSMPVSGCEGFAAVKGSQSQPSSRISSPVSAIPLPDVESQSPPPSRCISSSPPVPSPSTSCSGAPPKWACPRCTYENWPKSLKCTICQSPRSEFITPAPENSNVPEGVSNARNTIKSSSPGSRSGSGSPVPEEERRFIRSYAGNNNQNNVQRSRVCRRAPTVDNFPDGAVGGGGGGGGGASSIIENNTLNNYEQERRLRQLRRSKLQHADWPWLQACMGIVNGESTPVETYLAAGGDPTRQLTPQEVKFLNRPSAYDAGYTLIHLAIRFRREDILPLLLASTEQNYPNTRSSANINKGTALVGRKRAFSHVNPDIAAQIRHHVFQHMRRRKGEFLCHFVVECATFTLPAAITDLPSDIQEELFDELLDRDVQRELEEDLIINWSLELTEHLASRVYALWNRTAGDCLLDSVLQASWGVFDRDNELRQALANSLRDASMFFFPRWREWESIQVDVPYDLDESQWQRDWAAVLSDASHPGTSLAHVHIFALAHILRRPIVVYGVKYVKSYRGEALGYAKYQGVYLPLLWEPSFCYRSPIALAYTRGHFSALVTMEAEDQFSHAANINSSVRWLCHRVTNPDNDPRAKSGGSFLPLMTHDRQLFTVLFKTQTEIGQDYEIMQRWLDVGITESGVVVAEQHEQRRPLLLSQLLDEWLSHYSRTIGSSAPAITYASDGDSDDE